MKRSLSGSAYLSDPVLFRSCSKQNNGLREGGRGDVEDKANTQAGSPTAASVAKHTQMIHNA